MSVGEFTIRLLFSWSTSPRSNTPKLIRHCSTEPCAVLTLSRKASIFSFLLAVQLVLAKKPLEGSPIAIGEHAPCQYQLPGLVGVTPKYVLFQQHIDHLIVNRL